MDLRNVRKAPPLNEELLASVAAAEGEPHSFFLYFFPFFVLVLVFGFGFSRQGFSVAFEPVLEPTLGEFLLLLILTLQPTYSSQEVQT